jgi:hypothetical protein
MERVLRFTLLVFVILLAGVAFPKVFFDDAKNIPEGTIVRAKDSACQYIFDSPIEPWLIMKLVVRDRKQETVFVDAYTLFRLKYATVANVYNPQTGALVCTGRTYHIWKRDLNHSTLPCG